MDSTIVCLKRYSLLSVLKITGFFEITLSEISRDVSFCLIITAAEEKNAYNGSLETVANNQSVLSILCHHNCYSWILYLYTSVSHVCETKAQRRRFRSTQMGIDQINASLQQLLNNT